MFKNVSFALNKGQLTKPTPAKIGRTIEITIAVLGAIVAWIGTAAFIPNLTGTIMQSILGLIMTILTVIKPFFGVETERKTVPVDQVTAMEEEAAKTPTQERQEKLEKFKNTKIP